MKINPWKRKGLSYVAIVHYEMGFYGFRVTRKLSFVAYHLIKWYHGEDRLIEIGTKR